MSQTEILLESGTNELEIIEFYMVEAAKGGERRTHHYGINVAKVLEVIESPNLQAGCSAVDPCFLGTIPLRERVLPVLDLCVWLQLERVPVPNEIILVTEFNNKVTGFLASGVTQIYRVGWNDVEPPGRFISGFETNCITGLVHLEDHFVQLLDLEKVLADFDPDFGGALGEHVEASPTMYTALVADDSRLIRTLIQNKLEEANFKVVVAQNGEEAWKMLERFKALSPDSAASDGERIDILVSDIEMPRMDGMALTKRVKSDPQLKKLPVVLFSSLITDALRHKGESVGADDQISKPNFSELAGRAIRLIESAQKAGAGST